MMQRIGMRDDECRRLLAGLAECDAHITAGILMCMTKPEI